MYQFIRKTIIVFSVLFWSLGVNAEPKQDINYQGKSPKYIFLFIGDGMSFPQVTTYGVYKGTLDKNFTGTSDSPTPNNPPKAYNPSFTEFPFLGAAKTYDASKFITDSASAATAIASGYKTLDGRLGVDSFGKSVPSIAELLKKNQYKIGIVTNVSLDHATPAGFYAHQQSRNNYYEIANDLVKSNFDYFGGGGFKRPQGKDKKQTHVYDIAKSNGYLVVTTDDEFKSLDASKGKVIAVDANVEKQNMTLLFSLDAALLPASLTLADYTSKGIELLKDNPQGFFMMIESGKIDWAAHANDGLTVIKDVESLEKAVDVAIRFYEQHPDETLILVTGDHETGGMSVGFGGSEYDTFMSLLQSQTISYEAYDVIIAAYRANKTPFADVLKDIEKYYGLVMPDSEKAKENPRLVLSERELTKLKAGYEQSMIPLKERNIDLTYKIEYTYGGYEPLQIMITHILNNKAGIGWTTTAHSGLPVPVYAKGAGAEAFAGYYENTGIFERLKAVTQVK